MKNTLFEIHIDSKKFKSQTGFARISHKSEFLSEKEVLFNPLSKFKVLEVVKRQRGEEEIYYVKLSYDELGNMIGKNPKKINREEKILRSLSRMLNQLKKKICCFGDALVTETDMLKGG